MLYPKSRVKWERIAGDALRESGEETVYVCKGCNQPKLYRNNKTGLWICHKCGYTGRVGRTGTSRLALAPVSDDGELAASRGRVYLHKLRWARDASQHSDVLRHSKLILHELRHIENWMSLVSPERSSQERLITSLGNIAVPLYLGGEEVGVHSYACTRDDWYYCTHGLRGLYTLVQSGMPFSRWVVMVHEGLFDCLSVWDAIESMKREKNTRPVLHLFTVGNRPSYEQYATMVEEIQANCGENVTIYIMYDSDKLAPAQELARKLSVLFDSVFICVPEHDKDWDEYVHRSVNAARALFTYVRWSDECTR